VISCYALLPFLLLSFLLSSSLAVPIPSGRCTAFATRSEIWKADRSSFSSSRKIVDDELFRSVGVSAEKYGSDTNSGRSNGAYNPAPGRFVENRIAKYPQSTSAIGKDTRRENTWLATRDCSSRNDHRRRIYGRLIYSRDEISAFTEIHVSPITRLRRAPSNSDDQTDIVVASRARRTRRGVDSSKLDDYQCRSMRIIPRCARG